MLHKAIESLAAIGIPPMGLGPRNKSLLVREKVLPIYEYQVIRPPRRAITSL